MSIAVGFFAALLPLVSGCSGHATVHMVPLGTKRIDSAGPSIYTVKPSECYCWTDNGELNVAMRSFEGSILGKTFEQETVLSLVGLGLPAGQGKDYRVDRRTARVRTRAGYQHIRAGSTSGILAVWDYGKPVLRGRFRITAKQQSYSVLSGWSDKGSVLYVGEFAAVEDRRRGEALRQKTQEGPMRRDAALNR